MENGSVGDGGLILVLFRFRVNCFRCRLCSKMRACVCMCVSIRNGKAIDMHEEVY